MAQTAPTPADAIPTAPSTSSPSTFDAVADTFFAAWATIRSQFNALATNAYNNAVDCYNNAVAGAASATASAASAASSAASATVIKWVSGTYAEGAGAWSPINYQSYRCKTAGSRTTDPSLDPTNWVYIGATLYVRKTTTYTAASFDKIKASTTAGAWSLTFPASPSDGDQVEILDIDGTFHTNNLTLLVNGGNKIMGFTTSLVLNTQYAHLVFVYDTTNNDWRF